MIEWRAVRLDEVSAEITVGHVGPMASEYAPHGIPFLRSLNIAPFRLKYDDLKFVTDKFHKKLAKSALAPGDVVIVRTGKPGVAAVVPNSLPVSNCSDLVIVRCGPHLDPRFLVYFVNSAATHHIRSHLVGAVQQHFNVGAARQIMLRLPPLHEQQEIVSVLAALDDKIELNRRMSETLEATARALFKDWFIDFGPVRAKMEGRQPPGISPEIAALFPDRLDEKGRPEGWPIEPLLKYARLISGGTPKTEIDEYWGGPIAWASAKDVSQCGETFLVDTERSITARGVKESSTRMIPKLATVVVARGATTGRLCMLGREMAMNQTCYAIHSDENTPYWLNCCFVSLVSELVHAAHGSVFDTITTKTIDGARITVAPPALRQEFEREVAPLFTQLLAGINESRLLSRTRDLLLPKLLSGELRVCDADKSIGRVA